MQYIFVIGMFNTGAYGARYNVCLASNVLDSSFINVSKRSQTKLCSASQTNFATNI